MAIIIPISSSWDPKGLDKAVNDINKAGSQLSAINKNTKKQSDNFSAFGDSVKKLGIALVATFGAKQIGQFFSSSIKGVIELEASQHRLRKLLLTTGAATNYQVDLLLDHADALEKVGVVSKENIYIAQSQLATFDLSAKTIKDLTPAILDYVTAEKGASASADDFKSMTNGLAQALQGNFASLTKTGFVLDENTKKQIKTGTESQRVAAIIGVLDSTYKGFNKSLLDTPEGQLVKLKQGFGDLKEEVGYGLLRSLQLVNGALGDVGVTTETVAEKLQGMGKEVGLVIEGLGALTAEVITSANSTERSFKGLLATFVTEITSAALTVPRWIVDWLQGKAPSTQFPKANASHAEHSKLAVAANKAREALKSQDVVTKDLAKTQDNLKKNTESLIETSISYAKFVAGTTPQSIQGATALAQGALATIQKQMSKQPKINDDLVKSFKDLATVIQTNFSYALDQAKTKLNI